MAQTIAIGTSNLIWECECECEYKSKIAVGIGVGMAMGIQDLTTSLPLTPPPHSPSHHHLTPLTPPPHSPSHHTSLPSHHHFTPPHTTTSLPLTPPNLTSPGDEIPVRLYLQEEFRDFLLCLQEEVLQVPQHSFVCTHHKQNQTHMTCNDSLTSTQHIK